MPDRSACIVGVAECPLEHGRAPSGDTPLRIQARAVLAALDMAGLTVQDVDGLLTAGAWAPTGAGQHMSMSVAEYLGIQPRYTDTTNIGGASFEAHLGHAANAIAAGYCEIAVITYGSTQRSDSARSLAGRAPELNMQFETPWAPVSPAFGYALAANRYAHEYGDPRPAMTEVALSGREWASHNPAAMYRSALTADEIEQSSLISDPLRKLDCCLVTDGGGAVVVVSEAVAKRCATRPIRIAGVAESHTHWTMCSMPDVLTTAAAQTGPAALRAAGIDIADIDLFEIYDSFTITVVLTLEALGICPRGEAVNWLDGRTRPGGEAPMNTNGGGLSCVHPGMLGIYLITEACTQLWGQAGERQVPGAEVALVSGTGGTLSSTATAVLTC